MVNACTIHFQFRTLVNFTCTCISRTTPFMKNWFWSIKNSGEVLSKLKCRGFRATSLSTYDFSTLYTTLPHNLIKEKLLDLIEWIFKSALKSTVHFIWPVMTEKLYSLPLTKVDIYFGHVRMYAMPYPISWIMFILNGTKLYRQIVVSRWVQIALLS